jgi:hypothetical protein
MKMHNSQSFNPIDHAIGQLGYDVARANWPTVTGEPSPSVVRDVIVRLGWPLSLGNRRAIAGILSDYQLRASVRA